MRKIKMIKCNYSKLLRLFLAVCIFILNSASSQDPPPILHCNTPDFPDVHETCRQCLECFSKRIIRMRDINTGAVDSFIKNHQLMCYTVYHEKQKRNSDAIACMFIVARYTRSLIERLANAFEVDTNGICGRYGLCNCVHSGMYYEPIEEGFMNDTADTTIDDMVSAIGPAYAENLMHEAQQDPTDTLYCEACMVVAEEMQVAFPKYKYRKFWLNSIKLFCYKTFPDSELSRKGCLWMFKVHQPLFTNTIEKDLNNLHTFCQVLTYCEQLDRLPVGFGSYAENKVCAECLVRGSSVAGGENRAEFSAQQNTAIKEAPKLQQIHFIVILCVFCLKFISNYVGIKFHNMMVEVGT